MEHLRPGPRVAPRQRWKAGEGFALPAFQVSLLFKMLPLSVVIVRCVAGRRGGLRVFQKSDVEQRHQIRTRSSGSKYKCHLVRSLVSLSPIIDIELPNRFDTSGEEGVPS